MEEGRAIVLLLLATFIVNLNALSQVCSGKKMDVVFIIDASASLGVHNFNIIKKFINDIIGNVNVDDGTVRFGAVTFSTDARVDFILKQYNTSSEVQYAITDIHYTNAKTNMASGFRKANVEVFRSVAGDRNHVPNVAIVIADGDDTVRSAYTAVSEAEAMKATGTTIIGVAIGYAAKEQLDTLVSLPVVDHRFYLNAVKALTDFGGHVLAAVCKSENDLLV